MGFPPSNAIIIRNGDGEPVGWDQPETAQDYYHDLCGLCHPDGCCPEEDRDAEEGDDDDVDYYARRSQDRFEEFEDGE